MIRSSLRMFTGYFGVGMLVLGAGCGGAAALGHEEGGTGGTAEPVATGATSGATPSGGGGAGGTPAPQPTVGGAGTTGTTVPKTTGTTGTTGSSGTTGITGSSGSGGTTGTLPTRPPTVFAPTFPTVQAKAAQLDILLVIDNSVSMADKQATLAQAVPQLVSRLVNPRCVDEAGTVSDVQPQSAKEACPAGTNRELNPVSDLHVGLVSSSLGGHGGAVCLDGQQNDHGELIATLRDPNSPLTSGFATWTGDGDLATFQDQLTTLVKSAGEAGCGYEATNEAWYRFLVDPEPPADVVKEGNTSMRKGINQTILDQRAAFLRPQSAVMVLVLSDENDCSVRDDGYSWLVGDQGTAMPKARAICATNPNDPCCRACADTSVPASCGADPTCTFPVDKVDNANLRCWDQKRRFGLDLLYPVDRYVRGLTSFTVTNDRGMELTNPLYAEGRDPSLVTYVPIVGVPWQALARNTDPQVPLKYKPSELLHQQGIWDALLGDVGGTNRPTDPFMIEQIDPRTGTSPITNQPIKPPDAGYGASPINGHEYTPKADRGDLQFACTFQLAEPRDCATTDASKGCDCRPDKAGNLPFRDLPLCQSPTSNYAVTSTQTSAKAYPGLRHLEIARRIGRLSVPASICPKTLDKTASDAGYGPVVEGMMDRLRDIFR